MDFSLFAAAIVGVGLHLCYFKHAEHHAHPIRYPAALCVLAATGTLFRTIIQHDALFPASMHIARLITCLLAGLYTSLIIYRSLLHPLNKFPGPVGARVSAFWLSSQLTKCDAFRQIHHLHNQYGAFVRVGPTDLSISHPKAVHAIYGPGSHCTKAAWYDLTSPMVSLQTLRLKTLHDQRRRVWSAAFGDKALRGYEQRIRVHRERFLAQIAAQDGRPINVTQWFNWYSFDVMGDLAFGRSFDMVDSGEEHWAIRLLNDGIHPLAYMMPVWLFRLLTAIPGLTRDWWRFINFCAQRLDDRIKTKNVGVPDISAALLAPLKGKLPGAAEMNILRGDSQLIIVAGSDTTATTLANIIYELGRHPEHLAQLRAELAPYMTDPSGEVLHETIANLEHLNGVIFETLRLHPPVPTALQRKTPPEGLEIDGTHIPGNTTVYCPQYVIGRNDAVYQNASQFIPGRWYSFPEMVKEKSAFAPFSTGPYGCIGKPLALLNIRTTLAQLVTKFDIQYAPGEKGADFTEKAIEHFTMSMGELNVTFTPR